MNKRVLSYADFVWTFNKLKEKGLDIMKYYVQDKYCFELRFNIEGVEYVCVVNNMEIPVIKSRYDDQKRTEIINIPVEEVKLVSDKDIVWFKNEELIDYMECISF